MALAVVRRGLSILISSAGFRQKSIGLLPSFRCWIGMSSVGQCHQGIGRLFNCSIFINV